MPVKKDAALGFIFVTLLIDVIGFGIIIPVVPQLIRELSDVSLSEASVIGGWLLFAYSFMQFICAPVVGALSDRFGRRPILLLSLFGFFLDYLLTSFAPTLAWLFAGRIVAGIMGASFTTAAAYIADISTPEKRAQNFGLIGAAFGLGFIIGPLIGGQLGPFGSRVPFLAAAGLTLINWIYGYFVLPESLRPENRRKFEWKRANPVGSLLHLKKYPIITGLVASLVLVYIAAHAVQSNWTFFTMEKFKWDERMVGWSLAFVGLMVAIVQGGLIRFVIPRLGNERSVYVGLALNALGYLLFALSSQSWMMFAVTTVYCLGGIAGPALQGIMSRQVPPNEQGELQGALTSLASVTSIIGPVLMTNTFAYFTGPQAPTYFAGAPMILGAVLSIVATLLARASMKRNLKAAIS